MLDILPHRQSLPREPIRRFVRRQIEKRRKQGPRSPIQVIAGVLLRVLLTAAIYLLMFLYALLWV